MRRRIVAVICVACVRAMRTAGSRMFVIARDFSPRVERHGASTVVLDVSGLGRLLGDPHAIGAELDRAAAARGSGMRIAVAPTQTSRGCWPSVMPA